MADTQSIASISRPATAQSDASFATALEQPFATHPVDSVAHVIDNIINLVKSPQRQFHQRSGSVASQASLERGVSAPAPSGLYVLHELEVLKQLLKHEETHLQHAGLALVEAEYAPAAANGSPTNKQPSDGIEQDSELANARADLLLGAAERNVKLLTLENSAMHQALRNREEEMQTVQAQNMTAASSLQNAQASIAELEVQIQTLQRTSHEQQSLIDNLQLEKQRSDSGYEDERPSRKTSNKSMDDRDKDQSPPVPVLMLNQTPIEGMRRKSKGRSQERSRSAAPKSDRSSAASLDLKKQLAEVELLLIDLEGKKAHNDALAKQVSEYQVKLDAVTRERTSWEERYKVLEANRSQEVNDIHTRSTQERQSSDAAVTNSNASHVHDIETLKIAHAQELQRLRTEQNEQVQQTNRDHNQTLEASEQALRASKEQHAVLEHRIQELTDALGSQTSSHEQSAVSVPLERQEKNEADLDRRAGQAEVRKLKKRHQEAIAQIRATAEKQLETQRVKLEQTHQAALDSALAVAHGSAETQSTEASARYQSDIQRIEGEHRLRMTELETKHQEHITYELLLKEDAIKSEMQALQDRLDASLTGQAEAERSVALCRQQKFEADKRLAEAETSFKKQLEAAEQEKESLSQQLTQSQTNLQELERKSANDAASSPKKSSHALTSAQTQLNNLEKSRTETQALWQKALEEKSELVRQNDFLVKELEALLTQRSKPRVSNTNRRDAQVQTDDWSSEPKTALVGMHATWKAEQLGGQLPMTPITPGYQRVKDEIEAAWDARIFETQYADDSTELPQLERVTSTNQTLFAEKLHEHLSEMQQARHEVAINFQEKLNSLAADKDLMDKMVTSSLVLEFAEQREKLMTKFKTQMNEADSQSLPDTPVDEVSDIRLAEQKLVQDSDRRLVERKSQIALQYAARFQAMTQEYDQEITKLLDQNQTSAAETAPISLSSPRSAWSVKSAKSAKSGDDDSSRYPMTPEARSVGLCSTPRSATSIPRAVPYPGSRHGSDATAQPRPASKGQRNWNSVTPQSLMRAKSPAGMLTTPASVVSDQSSETRSIASPLREKTAPAAVPDDEVPPMKPLPRASMESSIPRPGIPTRARERRSISPTNPLRANSKRLSSGMIYYHAPRRPLTNNS